MNTIQAEPEIVVSRPYKDRFVELSVYKLAEQKGYVTVGSAVKRTNDTEVKIGLKQCWGQTEGAALEAGIKVGEQKIDEEST